MALIGRHAVETTNIGGGSVQVNPPHQISVAEGLAERLGDRLTVIDGVEVRNRPAPAADKLLIHPETGEPGVAITIYAADGTVLETTSAATAQAMVGFDDDFPHAPARVTFRTRTSLRGTVELGGVGAGRWTISQDGRTATFDLESSGGIGAVMLAPPAPVTTFEVTDGADRIEATADISAADDDNPLAGVGMFSLVLRPAPRPVVDMLANARAAATAADGAVVVVGLTEEQETEAVDKATIALTGDQDALVDAVAEAVRRTIVVVNSATPVLLPWADQVDAILWAGCPGKRVGTRSPRPCSEISSPPVDWSRPSPPPTARPPRGRSHPPTGPALRRGHRDRLPRALHRPDPCADLLVRPWSGPMRPATIRQRRSSRVLVSRVPAVRSSRSR